MSVLGVGLDPLPDTAAVMAKPVRVDKIDRVSTRMGAFGQRDVKLIGRFDRKANRQAETV